MYIKKIETNPKWKIEELTSLDHGPLTSSGFKTFCHLCKHWTSVLPGKHSAGEKKVVHQELASDKHKKNTIDKQGEEDEIVAWKVSHIIVSN
jgi:hypothetical protein